MDEKLVLIVEDEETISSILSRMVKKSFKYNVLVANSYTQAIKMLAGLNPDLTFIDVNLGDGNGYDLLRKLRADKNYRSKIIMMSAYANEAETFDDGTPGADWFISKPFDKNHVLAAVQQVMFPEPGDEGMENNL